MDVVKNQKSTTNTLFIYLLIYFIFSIDPIFYNVLPPTSYLYLIIRFEQINYLYKYGTILNITHIVGIQNVTCNVQNGISSMDAFVWVR